MSVIQRIRDKGAWIIFGIIALALIAFILQDSSFRKGNFFSSSTTVGKVNGVAIEKNDFENQLETFEQMQGGRAQREQLTTNVWDYMVQQTLMQQEEEKLGLVVNGNKELSDILFGDNPPQWLQQAFTDPATGAFDMNAAKQRIAQMKKNANDPNVIAVTNAYIKPTIAQALSQKYSALISGAVNVPKWMAEKINADNKTMASVSYVYVPYSSINDSTVKVTDDDITAYIDKHKPEFKQDEETRNASYITFDATASKQDTAALFSQLETLKQPFAAATDNKAFLIQNSSNAQFYDGFKSAAQLQGTAKDTIKNLGKGQVFGPYLDNQNYSLTKVIDEAPIADSVKVRHILVATYQQQGQGGQLVRVKEDSSARKTLDSAIAQLNAGASWDSVAAKYSEDPGSKDKGGVYDYFTSGNMVPSFNDFCFTGKPGDKKVVQTEYGFHYIEILGTKGQTMGYKIADLSKPVGASDETINDANTAATQFAAQSRDYKSFTANAEKIHKTVIPSQEIKKNDYQIGALGSGRQFVRWIFDNKTGNVSEPLQIGDKFVVGVITSVNEPGLSSAQKARPQVENIVRNQLKAKQIIDKKFKGNTLQAIAQSAGVSIQTADSISFESAVIPAVGSEAKIAGAAFNKQLVTKASEPIAGSTGVFAVKANRVYATANLGSSAESIKEAIKNTLQQQATYSVYNALKKAATIKDNRAEFY